MGSPLARRSDPWSSHTAARRIEPTRGSKRAAVLNLLRGAASDPHGDGWVPGSALTEVGGSEGLRRLRELRAMGWPIERRPARGPGRTGWEYRLAPEQRPTLF